MRSPPHTFVALLSLVGCAFALHKNAEQPKVHSFTGLAKRWRNVTSEDPQSNELRKRQDASSFTRSRSTTIPIGTPIFSCTVPGTFALTFDDGPAQYTSQLLDILAASGVKATFFVNGNNAGGGQIDNPALPWIGVLRRMIAEGHQVASHSYAHANLDTLPSAIRKADLLQNEQVISNVLGLIPTYFRPPFFACESTGCISDVASLGYHNIIADIDTRDFENRTPEAIETSKNLFLQGLNNNPNTPHISLAHDIWPLSVSNLTPFMIETIQSRGLRAVTVGECLGDPPSNWYVLPSATQPTDGTSGTQPGGIFSETQPEQNPPGTIRVDPLGSCGGASGFSCQNGCCSQFGFCGTTSEYCGAGCQPAFGNCGESAGGSDGGSAESMGSSPPRNRFGN